MALFQAIIGNYGDDRTYSKIFDLDEYCSKEYLINIQSVSPIRIDEQKVLDNFS